MSHLSTERLALLSDDPPTPAELSHLAACDSCAAERRAYASLRDMSAQETARIDRPLTQWEGLRGALEADGLIGSRRGLGAQRIVRWSSRAAAALLLVAGGAIAGRLTVSSARVATTGSAPDSASVTAPMTASANVIPAQYASLDEARAAQTQLQVAYQAATAYIAQHDSTHPAAMSQAAMRTRLAALDHVSQAVGEALDQAPYDPVINGYYLTTLGQREAAIRQLNTALPVGMRITSY